MPTTPLDPSRPLASLRSAAGIGGEPLPAADLARARGVTAPTVSQAEGRGAGISLRALRAYVEALGGRLMLAVEWGAAEAVNKVKSADPVASWRAPVASPRAERGRSSPPTRKR